MTIPREFYLLALVAVWMLIGIAAHLLVVRPRERHAASEERAGVEGSEPVFPRTVPIHCTNDVQTEKGEMASPFHGVEVPAQRANRGAGLVFAAAALSSISVSVIAVAPTDGVAIQVRD